MYFQCTCIVRNNTLYFVRRVPCAVNRAVHMYSVMLWDLHGCAYVAIGFERQRVNRVVGFVRTRHPLASTNELWSSMLPSMSELSSRSSRANRNHKRIEMDRLRHSKGVATSKNEELPPPRISFALSSSIPTHPHAFHKCTASSLSHPP